MMQKSIPKHAATEKCEKHSRIWMYGPFFDEETDTSNHLPSSFLEKSRFVNWRLSKKQIPN